MRTFRREAAGLFVAWFAREEADVLRHLSMQMLELLEGASDPDAQSADPALARLLPDAHRDDAEASAEFRRLTVEDLVDRKRGNARAIVAALDTAEGQPARRRAFVAVGELTVRLDDSGALAWMRGLADMRLALAARLGIDGATLADHDPALYGVYDWLALVQEGLVRAVDR